MRLIGMESVDGDNMASLMKRRANIGLLTGGYEEATLTSR